MSDFEDNRKLWKHEDDFEKDSEGSEKYYSAEENGLEDDSELMKYDKKNTDVVTYLSESENFKLRNTEDKRKQVRKRFIILTGKYAERLPKIFHNFTIVTVYHYQN